MEKIVMPEKQEIPLAEGHPLFKDADFGQALKKRYEKILGYEEQHFDQLVRCLGLFSFYQDERIPFHKNPDRDPYWTKERLALLITAALKNTNKIWTIGLRKEWLRSQHGPLTEEAHIKPMPIWNEDSLVERKGTWEDQFNVSWLILSEGKFTFNPRDPTRMLCIHQGCNYGLTSKRSYIEVMRHRRHIHDDQPGLSKSEKFFSLLPFWKKWKKIEHAPKIRRANGRRISSIARKRLLEKMMDEQVLPFIDQTRSLRARDRVAVGLDKTLLPEMIAGMVLGVSGTNYRGQSPPGHSGDLSDGTEVKSSAGRLYGNIDSIVNVRVEGDKLHILDGEDVDWFCQAAASFSSFNFDVQFLKEKSNQLIALDAHWRISKTSVFSRAARFLKRVEPQSNTKTPTEYGSEISSIRDGVYKVKVRQRRTRINFGKMDYEKTKRVLSGQTVWSYLFHDSLGCVTSLVLACREGDLDAEKIVNELWKIGKSDEKAKTTKTQFQPYLMEENTVLIGTNKPFPNDVKKLNPRVLALGRQTRNGFKFEHWDPTGVWRLKSLENRILRTVGFHETFDLKTEPLPIAIWPTDGLEQRVFEYYCSEILLPYYRGMRIYSKMWHMSANIGFATPGERMVCILHGINGTGSDARGGDAVETDERISEVKTAVGEFGDFAGTIGGYMGQTYHLGDDVKKISQWKRIFFNRIIDSRSIDGDGNEVGGNLHIALLAPSQETMEQLHQNVWDYFSGTHSNSPDLQYPALSFSDDIVHPAPHLNNPLEFLRVAEFVERRDPQFTYPNEIPDVEDCTCDYCNLGGFEWLGGIKDPDRRITTGFGNLFNFD